MFILLLGLVAMVLIGMLPLLIRRWQAVAAEPCCGKCGYRVAGLPSFICPECGSDLREVGITAQERRGQNGLGTARLAAAGGLLFILSCVVVLAAGIAFKWQFSIAAMLLATMIVSTSLWLLWFFTAILREGGRNSSRDASHARAMTQGALEGIPPSRSLSVLFTDIKDFTLRSASSTRQGLAGLLRTNRQIVEREVSKRGGKVIKTIGDALLATFDSATNAVLSGLDIQEALASFNLSAREAERFELRIAISSGEVTLEPSDIFGPAVNIASRVQAIAEPGEVLFTEQTLHAMNAAEVPHELLGEYELKGVSGKVRVYRALQRLSSRASVP